MSVFVVPVGGMTEEQSARYMHWHVTGDIYVHTCPTNNERVTRLEQVLPDLPTPYPFAIGDTGYVEMSRPVEPSTMGKAKDDCGRNVFIVGKKFLFQRYTEGNLYMYTTTWERGALRVPYYDEVRDEVWAEVLAATNPADK